MVEQGEVKGASPIGRGMIGPRGIGRGMIGPRGTGGGMIGPHRIGEGKIGLTRNAVRGPIEAKENPRNNMG